MASTKCLGICISTAIASVVVFLVFYTFKLDVAELARKHVFAHFNTSAIFYTSAIFNTSAIHSLFLSASTNNQHDPSKLNFTWIDNHPIYKKFFIKNVNSKKRVSVLVVVSTAPKRIDRRNAIRKTWWNQCVRTGNVVPECIFITDFQGPNDNFFNTVQTEAKEHGDIHLQLVGGGATFGQRFLYHMLFAEIRYQYDYFVRIDDDQMFCFNRFLRELPTPPPKMFHWGWVHNYNGITRPEECIILLSKDLVETFLLQPAERLLCHPLADQMIASWLSDMKITKVLRHDSRIHHGYPINKDTPLVKKTDLCNAYISIHGVYSDLMEKLWSQRGELPKNITSDLNQMSKLIPINYPFDWSRFGSKYRFEPKLCINNPSWDTSNLMPNGQASYSGRQGTK